MRRLQLFPFILLVAVLMGHVARAVPLPAASTHAPKEPDVPPHLDFERTLDLETYVERMDDRSRGAQAFRFRTRYLDPDVNAFVGFITEVYHFNQDLIIGKPEAPQTAGTMWNWGIDMGLKRGKSIWELDLMGSLLSSAVGPTLGFEGDHTITKHWGWYHRTELDFYLQDKDNILDSDQGFFWQLHSVGLTAGYRIFAGDHLNHNGFRMGLRWSFENPKIPFIFPSLG